MDDPLQQLFHMVNTNEIPSPSNNDELVEFSFDEDSSNSDNYIRYWSLRPHSLTHSLTYLLTYNDRRKKKRKRVMNFIPVTRSGINAVDELVIPAAITPQNVLGPFPMNARTVGENMKKRMLFISTNLTHSRITTTFTTSNEAGIEVENEEGWSEEAIEELSSLYGANPVVKIPRKCDDWSHHQEVMKAVIDWFEQVNEYNKIT